MQEARTSLAIALDCSKLLTGSNAETSMRLRGSDSCAPAVLTATGTMSFSATATGAIACLSLSLRWRAAEDLVVLWGEALSKGRAEILAGGVTHRKPFPANCFPKDPAWDTLNGEAQNRALNIEKG